MLCWGHWDGRQGPSLPSVGPTRASGSPPLPGGLAVTKEVPGTLGTGPGSRGTEGVVLGAGASLQS